VIRVVAAGRSAARRGDSHIYAKSTEDLFFAQGFVSPRTGCGSSRCGGATARRLAECSARVRDADSGAAGVPRQLGRGIQEVSPGGRKISSRLPPASTRPSEGARREGSRLIPDSGFNRSRPGRRRPC
jgi:hypothetical protein